ncbi:MAG TPA: 2-deoxy-scyllo-inosose synthase [Streptosporangiaceae bacterium]|nr:2-deoxy-scyllo-inosose synthase [Streptosporangiaceae bacterium]
MTTLTPARPATATCPAPGSTLMLDRDVRFGDYHYAFHLRAGQDAWAELAARVADLNADHIFVITDSGVPDATVRAAEAAAAVSARVTVLTVPATEQAKNATTVIDLAAEVIAAGATRSSVVIGLGGGLAGNVAGTVAGWVYRGAPRLVQIPTTLLALSDSVLSLKQAINSPWGKNHLGCFKAPVFVWGHLDILRTLPAGEKRAALCETAKNVLAICPDRYGELAELLRPEADYTDAELAWIVDLCLAAKQSVMAADPYEAHRALILEYGHTAGHAAEHLSCGRLGHGPAIAVGMLVAARVSARLGLLSAAGERAHHYLLERNGIALSFPPGLTAEALLAAMRRDNKRGYQPPEPGRIDMVLLDALGRPHIEGGRLLTQVPEDVVLDALRAYASEGVPA